MQGRLQNIHPVFHVALLHPWKAGGSSREPPPPLLVDGAEEYQVEKILQHRRRGRSTQYLIKWLGYDEAHNAWLNEEDLVNAQKALA